MTENELIQHALELGFAGAVVVDTKDIVFDPMFRPYCEENFCGQYGVNHSCPPACGTVEEMKQRILSRKRALVLQTIWEIYDYSDGPATKKAKNAHNSASLQLLKKSQEAGMDSFLVGASGCSLCSPCALKNGEPCRFPDLKHSCMSAYCIFVKKLCDHCGLEYDCGEGLLAFFGMLVFD